MARTTIAAQPFPLFAGAGYYPAVPLTAGSADVVWTVGDPADGHVTPIVNNKTLLVVHNTDSGAHTVTIRSVPDQMNRSGDITAYSIAADAVAMFGLFPQSGWNQTSPTGLWVDVSDTTVKLAVITTP